MKSVTSLIALSALLALAGCGGGGSSGPVVSTETFQLRTAYVNYITDTRSLPFTVSGTVSGTTVTGSGTLTSGTLASTTFENQPALAKTTTVTGTLSASGQTAPLATTTTAYVDSNYNPLGFNATDYTVITGSSAIPTTARINDTATWYSAIRYSSSSKTLRRGTTTASFVLEPDTASTALLKIIEIQKDTSNAVTSTATTTFRMTPAGALTRLSESVIQGTTTLTLAY